MMIKMSGNITKINHLFCLTCLQQLWFDPRNLRTQTCFHISIDISYDERDVTWNMWECFSSLTFRTVASETCWGTPCSLYARMCQRQVRLAHPWLYLMYWFEAEFRILSLLVLHFMCSSNSLSPLSLSPLSISTELQCKF